MIEPKITWQKWVDPFGADHDETKWNNYEDESESDVLNEYIQKLSDQNNSVKVIASPLGIIPYNEHTASSKIFNFWVGHTNFSITSNIVSLLENADGVEILDIFTRYRFRIAIGKCFVDSDVMQNISKLISNHFNENRP